MQRILVVLCGTLLALALGFPAAAADWDQAKLTDLAKQLATEAAALSEIADKNPDKPPGAGRKAQYTVRDDLRMMASATKRLAKRLREGGGRDETEGLYKRAASLRRDAETTAKGQDVLANAKAQADKTLALFDQLAVYYTD